ncbi:MAG: TraI domain-containing protein [Burkholderiaceae bacterium]|nr:TraI domain-containing protein [Burkholderiaceae bacterium]
MSLANLLKRLRVGAASAPHAPPPEVARAGAVGAGINAGAVEALLADQRDVIARIKLCYGCDNATFSADLLEPIRNYAGYVNALPATAGSDHGMPGGMLRLGLEVAFYALQATDSQIFAGRQTISNRLILEPRWRRATFIAGLCGELYRCFGQVRVRDAQGDQWQPYLAPLSAWLRARRCTTFHVQWLAGPERRAPGLFALPMIVPAQAMADLAVGNDVIVPNMLAAISGLATYHDHNVMDRLVRHATALVIHRQRQAAGASGAEETVPVHLARHLVEAMRELVQSDHNWLPNASRSRLWFGADGLYLVWPNGAADVIRLLADERLPGAPDSAAKVLDILIAGAIVSAGNNGTYVATILPPGAPEPLDVVRIASPGLLLADVVPPPQPLAQSLEMAREQAPGGPRPAAQGVPARMADGPGNDPGTATEDGSEHAGVPQPVGPSPAPPRRRAATPDPLDAPIMAQLSLPDMPPAPPPPLHPHGAVARGQGPAPQGGARDRNQDGVPPPRRAALRAPMRLSRTVARALSAILSTLQEDKPQCHVLAGVLFVPLASLDGQGVEARQAWRALLDAGMLEPDEQGEYVQSQQIDGAPVAGVFIGASFVTGLPVQAATPSSHGEAAGHADA